MLREGAEPKVRKEGALTGGGHLVVGHDARYGNVVHTDEARSVLVFSNVSVSEIPAGHISFVN